MCLCLWYTASLIGCSYRVGLECEDCNHEWVAFRYDQIGLLYMNLRGAGLTCPLNPVVYTFSPQFWTLSSLELALTCTSAWIAFLLPLTSMNCSLYFSNRFQLSHLLFRMSCFIDLAMLMRWHMLDFRISQSGTCGFPFGVPFPSFFRSLNLVEYYRLLYVVLLPSFRFILMHVWVLMLYSILHVVSYGIIKILEH